MMIIDETLQQTCLGSFDVDDFILNLIGAMIGFTYYKGITKINLMSPIKNQIESQQ